MTNSGKIVVDTDVLIDFLRGYSPASNFINQPKVEVHISSVTVTELYSGVRSEKEELEIEDLINLIHVIDVDRIIAKQGGLIRGEYTKSHGTGIIDSIIAATSINHEMALATLNEKHYPMIDDLIIPYRKEY